MCFLLFFLVHEVGTLHALVSRVSDIWRYSDEIVIALWSLPVLIVYIIKIYDVFLLVSVLLRITLLYTLVGLIIILVYVHLA